VCWICQGTMVCVNFSNYEQQKGYCLGGIISRSHKFSHLIIICNYNIHIFKPLKLKFYIEFWHPIFVWFFSLLKVWGMMKEGNLCMIKQIAHMKCSNWIFENTFWKKIKKNQYQITFQMMKTMCIIITNSLQTTKIVSIFL